MNIHTKAFLLFGCVLVNLMLPATVAAAPATAPVDLATAPLANSTTSAVKPNLMFILDDSGSMDWDYLPDWANDNLCKGTSGAFNASCTGQPPFRSSDFNGIYYNPAIYYKPPVNADGSSKASQISWTAVKNDAYNIQNTNSTNLVTGYTDVEWCTDSSYTDCLRNDNYILPGIVNGKSYTVSHSNVKSTGSGSVATGSLSAPTTAARSFGPHYYAIVPAEYCDSAQLTNCQTTQTTVFSYPAKVRWCNSPELTTCQALRTGAYTIPRYPGMITSAAATITVGSGSSTSVSSIKVNGKEILSSSIKSSSNSDTVASNIASKINACTSSTTGNCQIAGYRATSSGNIVTITAPGSLGNITFTPVISKSSGSKPITATAFSGGGATVPGSFKRIDIVSSNNSYPLPGSAEKASTRTDCAGTTCTYAEEMTNFANWWTYYHTRMQAMKSAASLSFKAIDSRYRVGYSSINNNTTTDFLNIAQFNATQKSAWYAKLFAADPNNSTPLRTALSNIGRLYAGKLNGTTFNGSTANDPVEYSCQQNFTLLSTDGYWNSSGGVQLDGTTAIGNLDGGSTPRPMYEGPIASSDNLADAAKYYYDTDLRNTGLSNCTGALGFDVCEDNVFVSSTDNNVKQHMTTFTLGLGIDGTLLYTNDYMTATSGDFYNLKKGLGTPTVNWPVPVAGTETTVDDLWHAAVNGKGIYFSAKSPDDIVTSIDTALNAITARLGAGAAAATSTLNPVAGDNFAYVASYTTVKWMGNLEARTINTNTGVVSESASWCVENVVAGSCPAPGSVVADVSGSSTVYNCVTGTDIVELPIACTGTMASKVAATSDTRRIWTKGPNAAAAAPGNFRIGGGDLNAADFNAAKLGNLSQWSTFTPEQKNAAVGDTIVNYLRGQTAYDDRTGNLVGAVDNRLFRFREATLGDAVESQPAFIGKPTFSYTDTGYSAFKAAQATRAGTVYMGTNDGMMHAFNASTGVERWAYVPSMVIPNIWQLADKNYATNHAYFANGSPIISDIYDGSWKTILVAGLNGGGRGYYALDITNPEAPTLMWEFTPAVDADLGFTFGNPVITKKADGTWVVLVTSGYNNIPDTSPRVKYPLINSGNGQGYLYVLNASTGTIINKIGTGAGSAATPSGLAQIAAWADEPEKNNTAVFTYGGDLLGNIWRFDINAGTVVKFAELKDSGGVAQPVTTRPELGSVLTSDGKLHKVVFVGTGKYLETADLTDTQQQTLYAIKDDDTLASTPTPTLVNPQASPTMVQQTITTSGASRTASNNAVDFKTNRGWYINFPDSGERQNVAGQLVLGTLLVPTTVPSNTICSPGGRSWLNYFNYSTGGAVDTSTNTVSTLMNAPIVGINIVYIRDPNDPNGKLKPVVSAVTADHPTPEVIPTVPFLSSGSGFQNKRVIWRELIQ